MLKLSTVDLFGCEGAASGSLRSFRLSGRSVLRRVYRPVRKSLDQFRRM